MLKLITYFNKRVELVTRHISYVAYKILNLFVQFDVEDSKGSTMKLITYFNRKVELVTRHISYVAYKVINFEVK